MFTFWLASGPLLGRPAIPLLTASLYLAFISFAHSFHPGTLNFEFPHPKYLLLLFSIAFDINVNRSVRLFVSVPQLTRSSPPGAAS